MAQSDSPNQNLPIPLGLVDTNHEGSIEEISVPLLGRCTVYNVTRFTNAILEQNEYFYIRKHTTGKFFKCYEPPEDGHRWVSTNQNQLFLNKKKSRKFEGHRVVPYEPGKSEIHKSYTCYFRDSDGIKCPAIKHTGHGRNVRFENRIKQVHITYKLFKVWYLEEHNHAKFEIEKIKKDKDGNKEEEKDNTVLPPLKNIESTSDIVSDDGKEASEKESSNSSHNEIEDAMDISMPDETEVDLKEDEIDKKDGNEEEEKDNTVLSPLKNIENSSDIVSDDGKEASEKESNNSSHNEIEDALDIKNVVQKFDSLASKLLELKYGFEAYNNKNLEESQARLRNIRKVKEELSNDLPATVGDSCQRRETRLEKDLLLTEDAMDIPMPDETEEDLKEDEIAKKGVKQYDDDKEQRESSNLSLDESGDDLYYTEELMFVESIDVMKHVEQEHGKNTSSDDEKEARKSVKKLEKNVVKQNIIDPNLEFDSLASKLLELKYGFEAYNNKNLEESQARLRNIRKVKEELSNDLPATVGDSCQRRETRLEKEMLLTELYIRAAEQEIISLSPLTESYPRAGEEEQISLSPSSTDTYTSDEDPFSEFGKSSPQSFKLPSPSPGHTPAPSKVASPTGTETYNSVEDPFLEFGISSNFQKEEVPKYEIGDIPLEREGLKEILEYLKTKERTAHNGSKKLVKNNNDDEDNESSSSSSSSSDSDSDFKPSSKNFGQNGSKERVKNNNNDGDKESSSSISSDSDSGDDSADDLPPKNFEKSSSYSITSCDEESQVKKKVTKQYTLSEDETMDEVISESIEESESERKTEEFRNWIKEALIETRDEKINLDNIDKRIEDLACMDLDDTVILEDNEEIEPKMRHDNYSSPSTSPKDTAKNPMTDDDLEGFIDIYEGKNEETSPKDTATNSITDEDLESVADCLEDPHDPFYALEETAAKGDDNSVQFRTFVNKDKETCWLNALLQLVMAAFDIRGGYRDLKGNSKMWNELRSIWEQGHREIDALQIRNILFDAESRRIDQDPSVKSVFHSINSTIFARNAKSSRSDTERFAQQDCRDFFVCLKQNMEEWLDLYLIFKANIYSSILCTACNQISEKTPEDELVNCIDCPDQNMKMDTLTHNFFNSPEILSYNHDQKDGGCGNAHEGHKSRRIDNIKEQEFIIFCVTRLKQELGKKQTINKTELEVTATIEIIDRDNEDECVQFKPIAVITHLGNVDEGNETQGHFIADIFNIKTQKWVRTSDSDQPRNIEFSQISKTGYIYLYQNTHQVTRTPKLQPREQRKEEDKVQGHLNITQAKVADKVMNQVTEYDVSQPTELFILTSEMEAAINETLRSSKTRVFKTSNYPIRLESRHLQLFCGTNWLNDEIINYYMQMIVARSQNDQKKFRSVYAFPSFFHNNLMNFGFDNVKRWTKKVDIFSQSLILIPVNLQFHWYLVTIDNDAKAIVYYDSWGKHHKSVLKMIASYLESEHLDKKGSKLDLGKWRQITAQNIPQQNNGWDCGMFVCKYAEYLSRRAEFTFKQYNMPYFRRRMVYEISRNKILYP